MKKLVFTFVLALAALGLTGSALRADGLQLPVISVTPAAYDFGNVPVGALATGYLVVSNTGDLPLVVSAVKTKAPFNDDSSTFTVQPGQTRRITISFAPGATIQYNGVCSISSNAYNAPLLNVPISGMGVQ